MLAGFPKLWVQTREENTRAGQLFKRAWELSPRYGRAAAHLAWCHAQDVTYFWTDNPEISKTRCVEYLGNALPLIRNDPTALAAAGAAAGQGKGFEKAKN